MRLLIINGPNINMLGIRDKATYGETSYKEFVKKTKQYAKSKKVKLHVFQSNHEGKIIDFIQKKANKYDGIVVNLGAYTHYSYAIMDSFECIKKPIVEVHISDIYKREDFRHVSLIKKYVKNQIVGKGISGYNDAIDILINEG